MHAMLLIQLITLFLVLLIIRSLVPIGNRSLSLFLSFFLAIIYIIQLSSAIITGEIANYRFYENFNLGDALSVAGFYGREGFLIALALLISTILIHYLGRLLQQKTKERKISFALLMGGLSF